MNKSVSEQLIVSPNSATMVVLDKNGLYKHFGEVRCPFCSETNIVAGPSKGWGLGFSWQGCSHSEGVVAGHGSDITILFRGVKK